MREFVITADSTVDLPKEYLAENNNTILSLSYMLEDKTYEDMHGPSPEEVYEKIRKGALPTTSQINPEQAREAFEKIIKEGKDILHIGFSSGLSGSYNSARIAAEELEEEYPDAKIIVVDSLCASMGEGLLLYKVNEMKKHGKSLEETGRWAEENKLHVCHNFTVDDLNHLHRGGRVSKATAVLGTMVNIKPVMHVDKEGHLVPVGKVRGRKKSLISLVDRMVEQIEGYDNDMVMISHGDCREEAEYVAQLVKEKTGISQIMINFVGPVIGTHSGPGTMALFFMGKER